MSYPHENDMAFALEAVNKINRIRHQIYTITTWKNIEKV